MAASPLTAGFGQGPPKPELTEEFPATLCSDPLRGILDNFFNTIFQQTGSIGSVVVTPDRSIPGRALKYRRIIQNHVELRQFDPTRLVYSETPFGESRIQLWIFPQGVRPAQKIAEPWRISETTLFDASSIEIDSYTRKPEFGGVGDEPCDFGLSFDQFASVFKASKDLSAHVLFASGGRIGRNRANSAAKIAVKHLTDFGIPRARIRTRYVGRRKQAEMQLWLVPKGSEMPVFRNGALPY